MQVSITDEGMLILDSLATEFLGSNKVGLGFDGDKVYLIREDSKLIAKEPKEDLLTFKPKDVNGVMEYNGKVMLTTLGNYKQVWNQDFPLVVDSEKGYLYFDLPKERDLRLSRYSLRSWND